MRATTWIAVALLALATGCGDDGEDGAGGSGGSGGSGGAGGSGGSGGGDCELAIPTSYPDDDFETNAAAELAVIGRFKAFLKPMKDAEADLGVTPTAAELLALYREGTPSVESITSAPFRAVVTEVTGEFEGAAGNEWTPAEPPPATGGKYGSYIFSPTGRDLRQLVEKGSFGAALFHHAWQLGQDEVTPADVDGMVAIFGAHPSFPMNDQDPEHPDTFSAAYAKRRNPADDEEGVYRRIQTSLGTARAAAEAGEECQAELDEALDAFRLDWERSNFATVIYYASSASTKLQAAAPTDADIASALHGIGEAVGFVRGFRGLPQDARTITDAQIDGILGHLNAPPDGAGTVHTFATDTATQVPKLRQAIDAIADVYGFTEDEVDAFAVNN